MSSPKTSKAGCKVTGCKMQPTASGYCFNHDPARVIDRAAARRTGGRARHTPHAGNFESIPGTIETIQDARMILTYALAELGVMDNSLPRARALIALFEAYVKSIEIGEIEARLQALEGRVKV